MRLLRTFIDSAPGRPDRVRLCGEVQYDAVGWAPEVYWFEFPSQYEAELSDTGNPWLVMLQPLAMVTGETLKLDLPVDALLFRQSFELRRIWKTWYPDLQPISVLCDGSQATPGRGGDRRLAFFSGGIDAFFTVLKNDRPTKDEPIERIDDLLLILGFDFLLDEHEAFDRHAARMSKVANELGRNLITAATNMRHLRFELAPRGDLSWGAALASVALALEKRFGRVHLGSSATYLHLEPTGSHPLTDPLFSTTGMPLVHDGASYDRVAKTELVAQSDVALRNLWVCWNGLDGNCGKCNKCLRTMLTLQILDAADRAPTFDWAAFNRVRIDRIVSNNRIELEFFEELRTLARRKGRDRLARDIAASVHRSPRVVRRRNRIRRWLRPARPLTRRVARIARGKPMLWRLSIYLEKRGLL